jgi:hypothetical protein
LGLGEDRQRRELFVVVVLLFFCIEDVKDIAFPRHRRRLGRLSRGTFQREAQET